MMLLDLADACRKSGLPVVEVNGWRTRGHGQMTAVDSVIAHHTATSAQAKGDYPSLGIVRDGRSDLPGPLAQLGLGRDGTVYVIAAGVCYHAGATFTTAQDNWHAIGIEAEHDGLSQWNPAQRDAYARLCAALCEHYGLSADRVLGHREIAKPLGRKPDPTFDMDLFRDEVADIIEGDIVTPEQMDKIATLAAEKTVDRLLATKVDVKTPAGKTRNLTLRQWLTEVFQKSAKSAQD